MKLVLEPSQAMLQETARGFVSSHDSVDRLRRLRDSEDPLGYSPEVWREMADLGWQGIPFAESLGGLGLGMAEVVLISEALGEGLAPEPFLSSVVFGGSLLDDAGSEQQKATWLPKVIAGEQRLAVAFQEPCTRFDPSHCAATATPQSGEEGATSWTLEGEKAHVIDGFGADAYLVSARTSGAPHDREGTSLFLVPSDRDGLAVQRLHRVDSRNAASLSLRGVSVTADDVIGELGAGLASLEAAIDRATVALCAEMLGIGKEAFKRTLEYLKTREQFGQKIGSFQALQHRAAEMFVEIELCKSVVMSAARRIDESGAHSPDVLAEVSNAKARCSDAVILVTNEALQMHGGVGMTDEYDIGLFMKRARVCELTFGDAAYHRNRFATVRGF